MVEDSSIGLLSRSWESCLIGRRRSCFGRGGNSSWGSAVAKKPGGLIPTETASKWVGLRGESRLCELGVPMKRGVRRRPRCAKGVDLPDKEPCSGDMEVSDR